MKKLKYVVTNLVERIIGVISCEIKRKYYKSCIWETKVRSIPTSISEVD